MSFAEPPLERTAQNHSVEERIYSTKLSWLGRGMKLLRNGEVIVNPERSTRDKNGGRQP